MIRSNGLARLTEDRTRRSLSIAMFLFLSLAACKPVPKSDLTPAPLFPTPTPITGCVDFEDLVVGTSYTVGNSFSDSGATMGVYDFQWMNGTWNAGGYTDVKTVMPAGSSGNSMFVNNVNIGFYVETLSCVNFNYCDKGGNVNLVLEENALLNDVKSLDLIDFNSKTLSGIAITVSQDSNNCGEVELQGGFTSFQFLGKGLISFAVGGQELFIDNVCPCD